MLACGRANAQVPGTAKGTFSVDGKAVSVAFAEMTSVENLFDSSKKDIVVAVSDKPLGETMPDDEVTQQLRAREGAFAVFRLRIADKTLVNAGVNMPGIDGLLLLPGAWFEFEAAKDGAGKLKLVPPKTWDGHSYACDLEFAAKAAAPRKPAEEPPPPPPSIAPTPTLPPASTSSIEPKRAAKLMVAAMMNRDDHQAIGLIKSGVDPNLRDEYGVSMLSWAVMTCQPKIVEALVRAHADVSYERAPGMTILQEAGACPEAAKLLKAAGAK